VGLSRRAEDNATSRGLHRFPPSAEAGGFRTAGLTDFEKYARLKLIMTGLQWLQQKPCFEKMFWTTGKGET
jgi:hypothetical protein